LNQEIAALNKQAASLAPWGEFDPEAIARLGTVGIQLRFFETSTKKFSALDRSNLAIELISGDKARVLFVVVQRGELPALDAEEIVLPKESLRKARESVVAREEKLKEIDRALDGLACYRDALADHITRLDEALRFETARLSIEDAAEGRIAVLEGWVPAEKQKAVADFVEKYAAWHAFAEPADGESIPVLMRNSRFASLFEPITKILSLPDYFELDPTPFFAPFFAFFFGLCLGDVGYGLVLFIGSILAVKKGPASLRRIFMLGIVLSSFTMLAGLFLNTFFGHDIFNLPGTQGAFFSKGTGVAILGPLESAKGKVFPAMTFALYVGAMQILVGMVLHGINRVRNNGPAWGLVAVARVLMALGALIFLAHKDFMGMGAYVLGAVPIGSLLNAIPLAVSAWLCIIGLILLFLFNNPSKKLPVRLGLGFWELYQFAQGLAGDGLSYVRLFALGLAGGLLGAAFNEIAFMIVTDGDGVVHWGSPLIVFTLAILLVGHTLNLGLSALGAFVHSLRLTFVEFYNNLHFNGGAKAYAPLMRTGSRL